MARLLGTETEYAIRFSPRLGVDHPGNEALFQAIRAAVSERVHTRPGRGILDALRGRVFTENGGSLYYEFVAGHDRGGLVEAGTPECRSAAQLLVYQRAQDRLVADAAATAQRELVRRGVVGELGLLKNCRDARGNVYGAQESYEVELASGPALWAWRAAVVAALPFAVVEALVYWALLLTVIGLGIVLMPALVALAVARPDLVDGPRGQAVAAGLGRLERAVAYTVAAPPTLIVALAARALAFRPYRRGAIGFLVSRPVLSGAGTLVDDRLVLSEKALAIRRTSRLTVLPSDRGLLEIGHLLKPLHGLMWLDWRGLIAVFGRRQRLQLGLSDANLCDVAELLKLGTTELVLDLVAAGRPDDAPVPADPIAALHALVSDPTLTVKVPLRGGGEASALELQRFYQRRAAAWLREADAVPLDAHELVGRWGEVLDRLEADRGSLFGHLDWVTKARLLDEAGDLPVDARKKLDLRYHELGTGYHAWLRSEGLSPVLVDDAEIERAIREPPSETPALPRGRLVRALSLAGTDARVGWTHVRIGGPVRGRVIRLDEAREERR